MLLLSILFGCLVSTKQVASATLAILIPHCAVVFKSPATARRCVSRGAESLSPRDSLNRLVGGQLCEPQHVRISKRHGLFRTHPTCEAVAVADPHSVFGLRRQSAAATALSHDVTPPKSSTPSPSRDRASPAPQSKICALDSGAHPVTNCDHMQTRGNGTL